MKAFEQLTDKELLELTQEEVDLYISLKKAETGIKIIRCPEAPEYRELPEKDMTLYLVCGFYFSNREDAEEIANLVNSKISKAYRLNYNYGNGYDNKYAEPYNGNLSDVSIEKAYSKETYNSISGIINSNNKIKEAYERVRGEYDSEEEKSQEIVEKIYTAISEAKERKQQYEDYVERIKEYLRLANGDIKIAWNFFDKAYAVETSVKSKIMESEEYKNCVDGYKI